MVQAEAFLIIIKKKKKSRQASGIQEWPGHFKWRKNARIEKKGILEVTSIHPQNHGVLGLGIFYFNLLIVTRESKMSLLQPYSS